MSDSYEDKLKSVKKAVKKLNYKNFDSWNYIKKPLQQIAISLVKKTNQKNPPIKLEPICENIHPNIDINIRIKNDEDKFGSMTPTESGFNIYVFSNNNKTQRTVISHEIGHIFFYNLDQSPPSKLYEASRFEKSDLEWICYDFGRELLLPRTSEAIHEIDEYYSSLPSPENLKQITNSWEVTIDYLLRRLLHDLEKYDNSASAKISYDQRKNRYVKNKIWKGENWEKKKISGNEIIKNDRIQNLLKNLEKDIESEVALNDFEFKIIAQKYKHYILCNFYLKD